MPPLDVGSLFNATGPAAGALDTELAPSANPLALLPVRLETRFFAMADGTTELRVRIYPDKIHINSHNPALTADELASGQRFWEAEWRAGDNETARKDAWRELADRLRPQRAAWVARRTAPTNPDDRPTAASDAVATPPKFPDVTDERPFKPTARLLPPRWICTAYAGGSVIGVVTGKDIPSELSIAPDLSAPVQHDDDEHPAIDTEMAWMVDFDRAEAVGMGIRVPFPSAIDSTTIELLLVVGVGADDASTPFQSQLEAHHYTDGLAIVAPGTASNNSDDERAGYRTPDPQQEASFTHEWGPLPPDGSAAHLVDAALGTEAFARVEGGSLADEQRAQAMMTALWPSTWGYFLSQMIGFEAEFTLEARDWLKSHAIHYLRPGGPLPTIRCGRQPYGLLPVTSLDNWRPDPAAVPSQRLAIILASLRDQVWRPASSRSPIVQPGADANTQLVEILKLSAVSPGFAVRNLMGQHFTRHLRAFLGENLDGIGFWDRLLQLTTAEARLFGIDFTPNLASAVYDETRRSITAELVGDPSYIATLRDAVDVMALASEPPADTLLHALLRHSLLREHVEATARLLDTPETPRGTLVRDAELVNLPDQPATRTWAWQREQPVGGSTAGEKVADDTDLAAFRKALGTLADADVPSLDRHLAQTLDAAGHRLDAWITSIATSRLHEQRSRVPKGLIVGGYGWVENLRAASTNQAVSELPADEPGPLVTPAEDPGFIHAPSVNQASAAALLRNAHLAHGGAEDGPYAIELSSARVRLAKSLFAGVRQGQPLGAMLGYMFERDLHDARLDDLIDDFRKLAPLPGAETATGIRRLVVDGLKLSQRWQDEADQELHTVVNAVDVSRQDRLKKALNKLQHAVDAAADAINAEAAFQMVRGNMPRAAAALETVSNGQTPPPDLGFLSTPRTGVAVTHRVAVILAATDGAAVSPGWATESPRAAADPALAAWAARLLGGAANIVARVMVSGSDGTEHAQDVPLSALNLTPIDFVWATGGADAISPELAQRVLDAATLQSGSVRPDAATRLDFSVKDSRGISFGDLVEVATRAQRLLAGARPLHGADLSSPRDELSRGLDLEEFEQRISEAEAGLVAVRDELAQALTTSSGLRDAMMRAAAYGVEGAVPRSSAGDTAAGLEAQANTVLAEVSRRIGEPPAAQATDELSRLDQLLARLRKAFGPGFIALPRFTAANAEHLAASRDDRSGLFGASPLAAYSWLIQMERVRPALARMARPLRASEFLHLGERLDLTVAQYPHVAGRRWMGLKASDGADGAISLVLQGAPTDLAQPLCGVLVDEWTEVVPSSSETTAIAFQCNLPDSSAPQAILLATPPVLDEPWRLGTLNRVLLETLDLAHVRAVAPSELGAVAHFLPATALAFNVVGTDAVSTNLQQLTA